MINFGLGITWNIVISVLIYIAGLYIAMFIFNLVCLLWFRNSLHTHSKSMTVTLNTKFNNIKKLFSIMEKLGVKIDDKYAEIMKTIDVENMKRQYTPECKKVREDLTYLREEAINLARHQKNLEKNKEFTTAKNNVLEMDEVYRMIVACYNADVLGYNYWIKFLPNRWIFKIFKVREKDLI